MKWYAGIGNLLLTGLLLWACQRPVNPVEEGTLTFSRDTVAFDSIFTTLLTPSERLIVSNVTGRDIKVSRIWLEGGSGSEFTMIVDGIQANAAEEVIIADGDSIHIFVNLRSKLRDAFAEDYIVFRVGEEEQRVLLRARILDAYFLRARILQEGNFVGLDSGSFVFLRDTILTPEKPIIMDGPIFVPEGVTVTILPGTELFFTAYQFGVTDSSGDKVFGLYSWLVVEGTLLAEGTADAPIVFQGARLDSLYQENPAQWRGLYFRKNSRDNLLVNCRIKNALIGVQVDSMSVNANPKLLMRYSEIRNMGAHGLVGLGFAPGISEQTPPTVLMENCIVNTCKQRTVAILGGGSYAFYNCTFANFNVARFSRRTPQVLVGNWWSFDGVSADVYPSYTHFYNCVIWGSEDDEVVIDTLAGAPFSELRFDHCLLPLSEDNDPAIRPHLRNSLVNTDPRFNDYFLRDYRPGAGSPMIDAGLRRDDLLLLGASGYFDDFRNRSDSLRSDTFDLGAYEYYPIPE
ncbi:MAG: hypothetical protein OHK0039_33130 [Bacteroidia bacterium]